MKIKNNSMEMGEAPPPPGLAMAVAGRIYRDERLRTDSAWAALVRTGKKRLLELERLEALKPWVKKGRTRAADVTFGTYKMTDDERQEIADLRAALHAASKEGAP